MKYTFLFSLLVSTAMAQKAEVWLTKADQSMLFQKQPNEFSFEPITNHLPSIYVDVSKHFQQMDGFGYTLTGASAILINRLPIAQKKALLEEIFATNHNNIGVSCLRISVGASDLSDHIFTYNDTSQPDLNLTNFTLDKEQQDLIPILKDILQINPAIKILASPWTPPAWMKTNQATKGGSLKPEFYAAYAKYLVRYIQAMQKNTIRIDALTIQNEPLNPDNNPSLLMQAPEQATFIKKYLGPAFKTNKISTKIIVYDHNADRPDYAIEILNDTETRKFVDGAAFHLYGGTAEAIGHVHEAHPDKNLYFTEQWIGAPSNFGGDLLWHIKNVLIATPRHWCKTVLEWNLASDPQQKMHTEGGCTACLGALTIGDDIKRNAAYYIIAHASKFVRPNSIRVASNITMSLPNVAYKTPNGKTVLIVLNESDTAMTFNIRLKNKQITPTLTAKTVATFVW